MNIQRLTNSSTMPVYRLSFAEHEDINLDKAVDEAEAYNFGWKLARPHADNARDIDVVIYID